MNKNTGLALGDRDHLRQSIADILLTPIGSRVMRREYGSLVPELIDKPDNRKTEIRLYAAVAGALMRWEPRIRISSIAFARESGRPGRVVVKLAGEVAGDRRAPLSMQLALDMGTANAA